MVTILRYETPHKNFKEFPAPYVFLAGPTVRGHQQHLQPSWRFEAIKIFEQLSFSGTLIVPEFTDVTVSDKGKKELPIWEYEGLKLANCILFWVPRTRELIGLTTNFELGYWIGLSRHKVVYGRPAGAYRTDYLDILWQKDYLEFKRGTSYIYVTLADTVRAAMSVCEVEQELSRIGED